VTVLPPGRCGNGHELTSDNLLPAELVDAPLDVLLGDFFGLCHGITAFKLRHPNVA